MFFNLIFIVDTIADVPITPHPRFVHFPSAPTPFRLAMTTVIYIYGSGIYAHAF